MTVKHDKLYKELITNFFREFMDGFFSEVSEHIDYNNLEFLQQEILDIKAEEKHVVDILVRTKLHNEEGFILIHVEPQAQKQRDFNQRMFKYFCNLYLKHKIKILPIAVLAYDIKKEEPNNYSIEFPFFDVLDFNFLQLHLKRLSWKEYLRKDNPVVAALLSRMDYSEDEKKQLKKEFFRMILRLELDEARAELLTVFMETYIRLSSDEDEQVREELKEELSPTEVNKMEEMLTSWGRRAREEALQEGIEKGKEKGIEDAVKRVALKMLSEGYDIEEIENITGLSKERIEELKKEQ